MRGISVHKALSSVVIDKTIEFLSLQRKEIENYSSQTERLYEKTLYKMNILQQKIESTIRSNN